jgi:hypothetical protein
MLSISMALLAGDEVELLLGWFGCAYGSSTEEWKGDGTE